MRRKASLIEIDNEKFKEKFKKKMSQEIERYKKALGGGKEK